MQLNDAYWSNRYQQQTDGWDAGAVTTPLKAYIDQLLYKDLAILIPGCGNAYEAEYLMQRGFTNVTLLDISTLLCQRLEEKYVHWLGKGLKIINADFFKHTGAYDLVLEQTFFCALDPSLRNGYADKMNDLLLTDGKLVGVLFNKQFENGPPFGGSREEYVSFFSQHFDIQVMATCYNSIAPRIGSELFIKLAKKSA